MYPSLPAVSAVFPGHSTTPVLGPNYEDNERRRYSGGMLQRARNPPRLAPIEDVVAPTLPKAAPAAPASPPTAAPAAESEANGAATPTAASSAVSSPSASSEASESVREREEQYDQWLENMRVIEYLREYIQNRLEREDFDEESAVAADKEQRRREASTEAMDVDGGDVARPAMEKPLYPTLRVSEN